MPSAAGFFLQDSKVVERILSVGSLVANGCHSKLRPFPGTCFFPHCFSLLRIFAQAARKLAFERKITYLLFSAVLTGRSSVIVCKIRGGKRQLG